MAQKSFWAFVALELVLIGCLIGSISVTGVTDDRPFGAVEFLFERYQTFWTGILALVAAWYAGAMVQRQIATSERQHAEQRFRALGNELDALEGLASYLDDLNRIAPYVIRNGRDIDPAPLNLHYRVSTHTAHWVSNGFSELMDKIEAYNASDRAAVTLYPGDVGISSRHATETIALMGQVKVAAQRAHERISEIRGLDPAATSGT